MGSVWPSFVILDGGCTSYKGRSGLQDKIQAVLIFTTEPTFKERPTQSEPEHCRAGE